jgi:hypothetical protein
LSPLESGARPPLTLRKTRNDQEKFKLRVAEDQRVLRERAERLLEAAQTLDDVTRRTGLVLEAAMLHRLATAAEEQLAILQARHPLFEADRRSFAKLRPDRRSMN